MTLRRILAWAGVALLAVIVIASGLLYLRQQLGIHKAEQWIRDFPVEPVGDFGATRVLRILPLMEYHSADPALRSEVGLSYLVDTDEHRILYDVGFNASAETPSPLEHNMAELGIELAGIDMVFISHNHMDHVGGLHWQRLNTFSLGRDQVPFPNPRTQLIAPASMSYPGLSSVRADRPMSLGEGVGSTGIGTTGTLPRQLVVGWIEEHSLVVNVAGLGGVIIVGCGHQTVTNLLARYDAAFSEPLYGIVGGLHFPVPEGRIHYGPLDVQRQLASGTGPLSPVAMPEVHRELALLRERNLGLIAVSAHDSSDEVIELIRTEFGDAHRYIRVGEEIVITAAEQ
ncbi:MAG: MBL fold metallo-hydrolase [Pseudomonadales bacterium]|nr:MBL fold metallo-hydrolase [Halieaceae bacterium]MCP5164894.1 MBL fold metallo-hydrolase [Pseudomonadales bacterium]MCP5189988.1 MBL fold metallo-hydrolase [Pseudomonadales bacterium]MCP5205363.1 MBL fold metallo-hydrolase [Pseudomonadales bacterium]